MNENRGNKTHVLCPTSQTSLYRVALVGHLCFKCDEIRLSWVFYVQNTRHARGKTLTPVLG